MGHSWRKLVRIGSSGRDWDPVSVVFRNQIIFSVDTLGDGGDVSDSICEQSGRLTLPQPHWLN